VLLSDVLANIRKGARPLFNMVRTPEFAHILGGSVRDRRPSFTQARQLSPAFVDQLASEYRAGASVYKLQARHGVSRGTIAKYLRGRGLVLGKQPLSQTEIARANELFQQSLSLNAIGRAMGRDPKTVRRAIESATTG
jgi:hypothetical protein